MWFDVSFEIGSINMLMLFNVSLECTVFLIFRSKNFFPLCKLVADIYNVVKMCAFVVLLCPNKSKVVWNKFKIHLEINKCGGIHQHKAYDWICHKVMYKSMRLNMMHITKSPLLTRTFGPYTTNHLIHHVMYSLVYGTWTTCMSLGICIWSCSYMLRRTLFIVTIVFHPIVECTHNHLWPA